MGVQIELASPLGSYSAGEVVEGRVIVHNSKPDKIKEIVLLLEGIGRVSWGESESFTDYSTSYGTDGRTESRSETRTRTMFHTAEEKYVSQTRSLAGDGQNLTNLPEGTTAYPFSFPLPNNIPSTFTSKYGKVSYNLKAEIKRPRFKLNDRTTLPLTISGVCDLNRSLWACGPQETRLEMGSNWCVCRKGSLGFVLSLPKGSGFVPGEEMEFRAEITNRSNKKITSVKASIIQVATFNVRHLSKSLKKVICDIRGPGVEEGEYEVWESTLCIPPGPPTRLGAFSQLFHLEYSLNFEMKISGLSGSLSGSLPIMIGTIPLRGVTFGKFRPVIKFTDTTVSEVPQLEPTPSTSTDESEPKNLLTNEDGRPVGNESVDGPGPSSNYQGSNTNEKCSPGATPSAPSLD